MPCFHPITAYYSRVENPSGKRSLVFNSDKALVDVPMQVPCGRCIGCRLDRSRSWALRCVHEASLHEQNCFITLTFNDENLLDNSGLKVSDFQNFMKRLRQKISPRTVRFFHCGEYGEKFSRPHHHACLFGYDFPDKVLFRKTSSGNLYTSELLSSLWPFGFSTIAAVTFETAAYVARYVLKKWSSSGLKGNDLYEAMRGLRADDVKKRIYGDRHPEYVTMSRRPGIGADWYDQFKDDVYPSGFAVLPGGRKCPLPKFYDAKFELDNFFGYAILKGVRKARALDDPNNDRGRLDAREFCKLKITNELKRGYEHGS